VCRRRKLHFYLVKISRCPFLDKQIYKKVNSASFQLWKFIIMKRMYGNVWVCKFTWIHSFICLYRANIKRILIIIMIMESVIMFFSVKQQMTAYSFHLEGLYYYLTNNRNSILRCIKSLYYNLNYNWTLNGMFKILIYVRRSSREKKSFFSFLPLPHLCWKYKHSKGQFGQNIRIFNRKKL